MTAHRLLALAAPLLGGCSPLGDGGPTDTDPADAETEVITTVTLTFAAAGGGAPITASFRDPDGSGGMSGTTDPITLAPMTTYSMSVELANELATPTESITAEVEEESEEHQLFVYGSAVSGPAMTDAASAIVEHAYADTESVYGGATDPDLPVGLANTMTTRAAGTGELTVALRHLPELNGSPQKVEGLAEARAAGEALPGDVDAQVTFTLTVQ